MKQVRNDMDKGEQTFGVELGHIEEPHLRPTPRVERTASRTNSSLSHWCTNRPRTPSKPPLARSGLQPPELTQLQQKEAHTGLERTNGSRCAHSRSISTLQDEVSVA